MVTLSALLSALFVPFVALVLGFALGWAARETTLDRPVSRRAVTTGLATMITLVWMVSIIAAIQTTGYSTPAELHAVMGAVAGYFFKGGGLLGNGDKNTN